MDIEKAKGTCKAYINAIDTFGTIDYKCINNLYEPIDAVLSELEKKEAIINEMADYMKQEMAEYQLDDIYSELHNCNGMERNWTRGKEAEIKDIKEYFTKKAEKGE